MTKTFFFKLLILFTAALGLIYIAKNERKIPSIIESVQGKHIVPFEEPQDKRMIDSAMERAICIHDEKCPWAHDGWKETLDKHLKYRRAGEVLAHNFENWDQVLEAWKDSPSHQEVLSDKWCIYGSARVGDVYVMQFACE